MNNPTNDGAGGMSTLMGKHTSIGAGDSDPTLPVPISRLFVAQWHMNGFAIVSTTYAFLAAFLVLGKIRFHHRLKSQGFTVRNERNEALPGNTTIDKEATDDFMDLTAVLLIVVAFFFEMMNQFANFDWDLNHLVVVPIVYALIGGGLVGIGLSTDIITTEYDNDSWTRAFLRSRRLAILYFGLSIIGVIVLTADAIATSSYELLILIAWIPYVPLFALLILSTFAGQVFGRPRFTPKP